MHPEEILRRKREIIHRYGEWTAHNILLGEGIYTIREEEPISRVRARQYLQIVSDILRRPFSGMRVLDLGCLEGLFAIEFAAHGAESLGIDIREGSIAKAGFAAEALGLGRAKFLLEDVRNLCPETLGGFDVILCAGILYHLQREALLPFLQTLMRMLRGVLIIDTHIALHPTHTFDWNGATYAGCPYPEDAAQATSVQKSEKTWASADNTESFWLTEASLLNALHHVGCTTVFEVKHPPVVTTPVDRKTFVAPVAEPVDILRASPRKEAFSYEFLHPEHGS
ncbi:class I SAM-dependent methyltransferase, partial [Candidatus Peregrinibacteria bacterium]|nr:class I SAM-dependent methyltransferase [Candidatus Peregrinibacteria bacterium]